MVPSLGSNWNLRELFNLNEILILHEDNHVKFIAGELIGKRHSTRKPQDEIAQYKSFSI